MSREQGMYTQQQPNMFPQAQGMYGQGWLRVTFGMNEHMNDQDFIFRR